MKTMPARNLGFTLLEMVIVVAVIAILALMAIPVFVDRGVREHVKEGMKLADFAQKEVEKHYLKTNGEMPADNATVGLQAPNKIANAMVTSVTVADGAVTIEFGNNAHSMLQGKKLTMRPMIVPPEPTKTLQPVTSWLCNDKPAPVKPDVTFEVKGKNVTDIPYANLPVECRGGAPK